VYHDVGQGAMPSVEIPLVHLPRMETFFLHLYKEDAAQLDYLVVSALTNIWVILLLLYLTDSSRSSCRVQQLHLGDNHHCGGPTHPMS